jgi:uncharacterized protein
MGKDCLMRPDDLEKPLSQNELVALTLYLERENAPLSLSGLHGMIAAVATAPGLIPPAAWIPSALGEASPATQKEGERVLGKLMRLYNQTVRELEQGKPTLLGSDRQQWCAGYLSGAELDPTWMENDEWSDLLAPIRFAAEGKAPDKAKDPEGLLRRCIDNVEGFAADIHSFFSARRKAELQAATKPAVSQKVGRNETCPCGSGKKFKKCCGFN